MLQVDGYAGFERLRLQHPSGQFLYNFKEMLLMLTYLAAVLRLFWLMGKSDHTCLGPSKLRDMTEKHPKRPRFWRFCMSGQCGLASNQMDRWC